jgi:hypothetical protein
MDSLGAYSQANMYTLPFLWPLPLLLLMPMPMPICRLQMSMLHAQYINPLFANAETFGAIPVPEAIPVPIPDAVADALANVDANANANL